MQTYIMTKSQGGQLQHAYTLRMLKLQLLGLSLWQPGLVRIKSLTSGTPYCILGFQSGQKATCLVTTNVLKLQFNWKDGKSNL